MTLAPSEITAELVARAADGDRAAVEAIVRALQRPVLNVAVRMLRSREDAEDATQEALLRIVTRLGQFRGDARFATWAWRIAVRRILDARAQRAAVTFDRFAEDLADGLDPGAVESAEDAVLHRQLKTICSQPADVAAIVERYRDALCRSPLPKLLFTVEPGALVPPPVAAWARAHLPHLEVVHLGAGRHYVQEDHPHAIGEAIAAWLRSAAISAAP